MKGYLFVLGATLGFSFKGVFAKLVYARNVTVATVLFYRFALTAPFFWLGGRLQGKRQRVAPLLPSQHAWLAAAGTLFFVATLTDFLALQQIDASVERVILFSYPAIYFLLELVFFRKCPQLSQVIAFGVTQGGLVLVTGLAGHAISPVSPRHVSGYLEAVVAALTYAGYMLASERIVASIGSIRFTLRSQAVTLGWVLLFCALKASEVSLQLDGHSLIYMLAMALFCTALPFFLLAEGIRHIGAGQASLIAMVGPAVTLLVAHWVLAEPLTSQRILGLLVVVVGVALLKLPLRISKLRR